MSGTSSYKRPLFRQLGAGVLMAAKTLPAFRASSASVPDVPQRQRELLLAVHTRQGVAHEDFHLPVAHETRQLQRHRHVLPELPLALRVACQYPVTRRHIPGIEVYERNPEVCVFGRLLDCAGVLAGGLPELDYGEARLGSLTEPLQKQRLPDKHRNVCAELYPFLLGTPLVATSLASTTTGPSSGFSYCETEELRAANNYC